MKYFIPIAMILFTVGFSGCKRLFDNDESLDNSYTISGHLFKGSSDEPYPNAPLILEGYEQSGFSNGEFTDLGSATTDESGYFSITYEQKYLDGTLKFGGSEEDYVELRFDQPIGGRIMLFPWNTNVSRDFAENNHCRVFVILSNEPQPEIDSLYFGISMLVGGQEFMEPIYFPNEKKNEVVVKVDTETLKSGLLYKTSHNKEWNNSGSEAVVAYGSNVLEFEEAFYGYRLDPIPDDLKRASFQRRGFPFTDTVKLEL